MCMAVRRRSLQLVVPSSHDHTLKVQDASDPKTDAVEERPFEQRRPNENQGEQARAQHGGWNQRSLKNSASPNNFCAAPSAPARQQLSDGQRATFIPCFAAQRTYRGSVQQPWHRLPTAKVPQRPEARKQRSPTPQGKGIAMRNTPATPWCCCNPVLCQL